MFVQFLQAVRTGFSSATATTTATATALLFYIFSPPAFQPLNTLRP